MIMRGEEELLLIPKLGRRGFFEIGATTFMGFHLLPMLGPLQAFAERKVKPRGTAEFCIFLHLVGGPSQVDTFDLKEGRWTPDDFGIHKITPEVSMPVGLLPQLSAKLNHLAIVRSAESWEGIHERGQYYIQAGRAFSPARVGEIPSVGSLVAYEFQSRRRESDCLPPFVAMNFTLRGVGVAGPGMLPASCAPLPLTVEQGADVPLVVPKEEQARFADRWKFLQTLDGSSRDGRSVLGRPVDDYTDYYLGAYAMMKRPEIGDVLRLPDDDHKRYGATGVGDACILARNLVAADAGTRFIMIAHPGWDLHTKEYDKTQKVNHYTLCREIDNCLGSLLQDLANTKDKSGRTLLEKTLIVSMGEFGRTPGPLTHIGGRDHHRFASVVLFAGGGVKGDRVIGATDEIGGKVVKPGWHGGRSVYPEDVVATIYSAMGIDWTKRIQNTPSGRVFSYVDGTSASGTIDPDEVSELFV
jgi:hypothetical protein